MCDNYKLRQPMNDLALCPKKLSIKSLKVEKTIFPPEPEKDFNRWISYIYNTNPKYNGLDDKGKG